MRGALSDQMFPFMFVFDSLSVSVPVSLMLPVTFVVLEKGQKSIY